MAEDEEYHRARSHWKSKAQSMESIRDSLTRVTEVSRPKIQRIPRHMTDRKEEYEKFYKPGFISIGPIHDGSSDLKQGMVYKVIWTHKYLEHTNQSFDSLFPAFYSSDLRSTFSEECCWPAQFIESNVKHMFQLAVDGCSILQVLEKSVGFDHPERELNISIDQLVRVHQDLILLENQIPFQVLKLVCSDASRLNRCLQNFLSIHGFKNRSRTNEDSWGQHHVTINNGGDDQEEPVHLLDYLRRAILNNAERICNGIRTNHQRSMHLRKYRVGTIQELKAAGVRVRKRNSTHESAFRPNFVKGELQLPEITVDGSTALIYLNLIAYEMCPDFQNEFEISSLIVFMSSLINQPSDVRELRGAGVSRNELASDKEVANLFNKMDTVLVPETTNYASIVDRIEEHLQSKRSKIKVLGWMEEAYNGFLRSPWTIIAVLAATLGLTLTFIQTWYTVHPKGS